LFEYWAGDDSISTSAHQTTIYALQRLVSKGVQVYLMHGNRDFLLGEGFANVTGIKILPDPDLVTLYGKPVLLSHGDALCKDDIAYQKFRTEVRSSTWQTQFLSQSLSNRIAYIEQLRSKSEQEKSAKSMLIMDVSSTAVEALLRQFNYPPLFIHGHTHRPNNHVHVVDGNKCERWVLGDWYEQGSYLKLSKDGCHSQTLAT
jgi:UDP-2,3-diacylglucosamine hydrolase